MQVVPFLTIQPGFHHKLMQVFLLVFSSAAYVLMDRGSGDVLFVTHAHHSCADWALNYFVALRRRIAGDLAVRYRRIGALSKHEMEVGAVVSLLQAAVEVQDGTHFAVYNRRAEGAVQIEGQSGAASCRLNRRSRRPLTGFCEAQASLARRKDEVVHVGFLDVPMPARKSFGVPIQVILNGKLSSRVGMTSSVAAVERGVARESTKIWLRCTDQGATGLLSRLCRRMCLIW